MVMGEKAFISGWILRNGIQESVSVSIGQDRACTVHRLSAANCGAACVLSHFPLKLGGRQTVFSKFRSRMTNVFRARFRNWARCVSSSLAKADRRPREKKKFYHHFSIVKYSYLPKDTFKKLCWNACNQEQIDFEVPRLLQALMCV